MTEFLLLLILGLVVARATRLWRDDTITENLRERVEGWLADRMEDAGRAGRHRTSWVFQKVGELLECPWCISGWLSILAVVAVDSATSRSVPVPLLSWLAVWQVSNLAYWLTELVADRDALAWAERENRGIT